MSEAETHNLPLCDFLFTEPQRQRLNKALKLLRGISHLPLEFDDERAQEIKNIYGVAKEREKK